MRITSAARDLREGAVAFVCGRLNRDLSAFPRHRPTGSDRVDTEEEAGIDVFGLLHLDTEREGERGGGNGAPLDSVISLNSKRFISAVRKSSFCLDKSTIARRFSSNFVWPK